MRTLHVRNERMDLKDGDVHVFSFKEFMREIQDEKHYDHINLYGEIMLFHNKILNYMNDEEFIKFITYNGKTLEITRIVIMLYEIAKTGMRPSVEICTQDSNETYYLIKVFENSFESISFATNRKTRIIVIEGGEMSGKTTIVNNLKKELASMGFNVLTSREPGGCAVGEKIRSILLDPRSDGDVLALDRRTEELLFLASRRAHLLEKLLPAIHSGEYDYIILDRFIPSSMVYQGYAQSDLHNRISEMNRILNLNLEYTKGFDPNMYILLDISPEVALERRRDAIDRNHFDDKDMTFHNNLLSGYRMVFDNRDMLNYVDSKIVDASPDIDTVTKDVLIQILSLK